mmetsp:Transcript_22446/g.38373  ORF Transcript_22446/g.38373 Transcript_22446/m.38373 type:complete len:227 (-) Transcript_22446:960-1640(-)
MWRELTSASSEPSTIRMAFMLCTSQYVILRSVPQVRSWLSSGWYATDLKKLAANRALMRTNGCMSDSDHVMHDPSALAETHSESSFLIAMANTGPLCSFIEAIITWTPLEMAQTRTCPSAPPESSRLQSLDGQTDVTPFLGTTPPDELPTPVMRCASLMTYSSPPDWGRKDRTFPSFQPLMIDEPLGMKAIQLHSWLGTCTRSSSDIVLACQIRMSGPAHVAKSSE